MTTLSSLKKLPATERDSYIAALIRSFTPSPTDVRDDVELSRDIYQKAEMVLLVSYGRSQADGGAYLGRSERARTRRW
jgi:hypothetical protein